jgi:hypothetical protein
VSKNRPDLGKDEEHANTRHETGDHAVGHDRDVPTEFENAEHDLKDAGNHDDRKRRHRTARRVGSHRARDYRRHHDGHRTGGFRDQGAGSPKDRSEQPYENRAVQTGLRTQPRHRAECECHRQ